ncbi:hypothetical protein K435DRAFT_303608 [Dendrothele bispora CBS 962.96]|uniref:Uncharacterized protein n=1 Tax=Dendrothele bispora (strain CBS 962.96) TaxID=1314807 RepID=A0A4V4HHK9_DENBC|nr:hypothetical protein K435DRAFT_303608 [Dendrothele bispora CBS 962.96]
MKMPEHRRARVVKFSSYLCSAVTEVMRLLEFLGLVLTENLPVNIPSGEPNVLMFCLNCKPIFSQSADCEARLVLIRTCSVRCLLKRCVCSVQDT